MAQGVIYKLTNVKTGKSYIGQTVNLQKRLNMHKFYANHEGTKNEGQPIVKAIREYGFDSFKVEVLYTSDDFLDRKELRKHLDKMEKIYIKQFNTIEDGYNISTGGTGGVGVPRSQKQLDSIRELNINRVWSEETKKLISENSKKMWQREGYREMMSAKMSGSNNPMYGVRLTGEKNHNYGKHLSEETKRKLSIANKGHKGTPVSEEHKAKLRALFTGVPKTEEHRRKLSEAITGKEAPHKWKPVLQYSLEGEFIKEWKNIAEPQAFYKTKGISGSANGKRIVVAGYIWRYKTSDVIPEKIDIPGPKNKRRIALINENGDIIKEYSTIRQAAKELGLHYTGICSVLQGLQKKTGNNYRFKYI